MIVGDYQKTGRTNRTIESTFDLVIAGGGMAGSCAAITAARQGLKVALIQDRPVLGGNASSEVRLWILGATSHMGNNNRWAREGGVIDEILVENVFRNREGNPLILDTIILEKVREESNISLFLNTAVYEVKKKSENEIESIQAFCSQNSTEYIFSAPLFLDSTGDGLVSFLAGAAFRMGAETKEEFGEMFAPDRSFGELLGHSIYFYSKKTDHPVKYVPPSYALKDIKELNRYKIISKDDQGCRFWWIEYGGRRDTIYDTEEIKWELWKVVYGIWNYIKNSGEYEDVDNLTLEWVGTIPGKRESRRFQGLYTLKQHDIVNQASFDDAIAFGGWALDLHPSDGVYSDLPGCVQYHSKGIYALPLRSYISKDIKNLIYTGRIISATHVAFGSSRVMATCAIGAQGVAVAASHCIQKQIMPDELLQDNHLCEIQQKLNLTGQSIPGVKLDPDNNLLKKAKITASSEYKLTSLPGNDSWFRLKIGVAQLLPLEKETSYNFGLRVKADKDTILRVELRTSSRFGSYTPDTVIESKEIDIAIGEHNVELDFNKVLPEDQYAFLTIIQNEALSILSSDQRMTGIMTVFNGENKAVNNNGHQNPPEGSGIDSFEFWIPKRRPEGQNLAFSVTPALNLYKTKYLINGYTRPFLRTNAWAADLEDGTPNINLEWEDKQSIREISLFFDTDYDNAMESVLMQHHDDVIPFVARDYEILNDKNEVIYKRKGNYQTINKIEFDEPVKTDQLKINFKQLSSGCPVSVFQIEIR